MSDATAPQVAPRVRSHAILSRAFMIDAGLALALVAITLWRLVPALDSMPFHRDEARWIGNASLLREWRHPLGIKWQDEGYPVSYGSLDEQNRRRSQLPLAMYLFGTGLVLQGRDLPSYGYWIMDKDTAWNIAHGNMPSSGDLLAARRTNVAIAVVTVVAIFFIGARLTNRVGGVAGALIYSMHPLALATSTRALSDPLLVLCVALSALAAMRLAVRPTWGKALLLGLLLGLGGATKLSPLGIAVGLGGVGLLLLGWALLWREPSVERFRQLGFRLLTVPAVAIVLFVAVYPYLWPDPVEQTQRMLDFRTESFRLQEQVSPDAIVPNLTDAFRRVGAELGERASSSGLVTKNLGRHVSAGDWTWLRDLDLLLAVVGWIVLLPFAVRRGSTWPAILATAVIVGQALLIILALDILYLRYLLPVLLAVAIGAGVACGVLWDLARNAWSARANREPTAGKMVESVS